MKEYISKKWAPIFSEQKINFQYLWNLDLEPLDKPNTERGKDGWSTVSLLNIQISEKISKKVVIKRQNNHLSRTLLHPISGVPTFQKEMRNIKKYKRLGIPSVYAIYYGSQKTSDGIRAILLTEYFEGFISLSELVEKWNREGWPELFLRKKIIYSLAEMIRKIHDCGIQHNCLFPKHIFLDHNNLAGSIKIIDLEKSKWSPLGNKRRIRDLECLHRRTIGFNQSDRLRFLLSYCEVDYMDGRTRKLLKKIARRNEWKKKV